MHVAPLAFAMFGPYHTLDMVNCATQAATLLCQPPDFVRYARAPITLRIFGSKSWVHATLRIGVRSLMCTRFKQFVNTSRLSFGFPGCLAHAYVCLV